MKKFKYRYSGDVIFEIVATSKDAADKKVVSELAKILSNKNINEAILLQKEVTEHAAHK